MKNFFYNKMVWYHTALFADLFNDMQVYAYDKDGKVTGRIDVPIKITPTEKALSFIKGNNRQNHKIISNRDFENVLPLISIQPNGFQFDASRARGLRAKRKLYIEYESEDCDPCAGKRQHLDMQVVPHKLNFEVAIWTKYMDDHFMLLENINTFLHPEVYVSFFEKGIGTEAKSKVELVGSNSEFNFVLAEQEARIQKTTYQFAMEMNLYKPECPPEGPINKISWFIQPVEHFTDDTDLRPGSMLRTETLCTTAQELPCYSDLGDEIVQFIQTFDAVDNFRFKDYVVDGIDPDEVNEVDESCDCDDFHEEN